MKTAHMRTHAGHHHCTAGRRAERRQLEDELTEDTLNLSPMDEVKAEYEAARTGEDGVEVVTGSCSGCGCSIAWVATSKGAGVCLACQEASAKLQAVRDAWRRDLATWHDFILDQIECVTEHGLPAAYGGSAFSFLCDLFGGDFPWTPDAAEVVDTNVRQSPRFEPLRVAFEKRFGVDPYGEDEEALHTNRWR